MRIYNGSKLWFNHLIGQIITSRAMIFYIFVFLIIQPFCTYLDFIVKLNSLFCLCYYSSIYICCNNSKGSMISSKVFPNIVFKSNQNLAFIGTELIQTHHLQMLPPNHPNIHIYTKAVQKLFSEIPILEQMLWICRIPSTSIIRIFFSEPYKYPCALCCGKPLFIEINPDFSGNFCCSTCNKTIAKFVYSEGGHGSDQALFLQKQRESNSRKNELRCLITSQKFRGKKLKNNFLEKPLTLQTGSFIMEITEPIGQKIVKGPEQIIEGRLEELRDIINDIFA